MDAVREARLLMGTRWEVLLPGTETVRLRAAAEEALDAVERLEGQLSRFRRESEISGLNAFAASAPVRVEPRLFRLLELAQEVSAALDGAFDVTIGPLLECWGAYGETGEAPDEAFLTALRTRYGYHHLHLHPEEQSVWFDSPDLTLDLGAIGKGYALDRAGEVLRDAGISSGLLHAGTSSVLAIGAPPDAGAWSVMVRHPRPELAGPASRVVQLCDRSLSVSAPHGRSYRAGSSEVGHVLDPRTGRPTSAALLAAVADNSAARSDALSTALVVLGPAGVPRIRDAYPGPDAMVIDSEGVWHLAVGEDGATL